MASSWVMGEPTSEAKCARCAAVISATTFSRFFFSVMNTPSTGNKVTGGANPGLYQGSRAGVMLVTGFTLGAFWLRPRLDFVASVDPYPALEVPAITCGSLGAC